MVRNSDFDSVPMDQLPGIAEIKYGDVTLNPFVQFVLARVAYVPDAPIRFEKCKQAYYNLTRIGHTDCDLLFSEEDALFQACTSWKKSSFADVYDRAEHFISIIWTS
jgi:hypothetical protein